MELKEFKLHKMSIASYMRLNLKTARETGSTEFAYCYDHTIKHIDIRFDDKHEAIQGKLRYVADMVSMGVKYKITAIEEKPYCTTKMVGTKYSFTIPKLREEITDRQVEAHMKNFVKKEIMKQLGESWLTIDCRIMELYKLGKINWQDVLEAHLVECRF